MSTTTRPRSRTPLRSWYDHHRYACLFGTLLLTLAAGPTIDAAFPGYNPLQILLAVNLLAALASVARTRQMRVSFALGAGFVVAHGVRAGFGIPGMLAVSEALWLAAIALATAVTLRQALRPGPVNAEHVLAALDAYLLAGLLFGVAYWMLDHTWPGSFRADGPLDRSEAIYFSFVTIATLGYGDIVPLTGAARGLAMVEGVSGQMYLAVLVARLVSLYARRADG
jgi:hypothetical protein